VTARLSSPAGHKPRAIFAIGCKLIALLFVSIGTICITSNIITPRSIDFISFWSAARFVLDGNLAAVYDPDQHHALQQGLGIAAGYLPFAYPPPFLLVLLPFGLMPYGIAAACWTIGTALIFFAIVARQMPGFGWPVAAFPAGLANMLMGQAAFLTAGIFTAASFLIAAQPFWAGAMFGLLVLKPQLGLLVPVALIAGRHWSALIGACCSAGLVLLVSLVAFGPGVYVGFEHALPSYSALAFDSPLAWQKMVSAYAALRFYGAPAGFAWTAQLIITAVAAVTVYRVWRGPHAPQAKIAVLAAATAVASPYMFAYDLLILAAALYWVAQQAAGLRLLAAVWCVMSLHLLQSWGIIAFPNVAVIATGGLLVAILCYLRPAGRRFTRTRPA
jgi:hypothetical protein